MFKFTELKQIHLEISNNCQASCPMCTRNIHGGLTNPLLVTANWSLDQYISIMSSEVLNQILMINFCGNYGDPLLNNNLIEMIKYTTSVNPDLMIRIHTNGSLRSTSWWKELAQALPAQHLVVFALDGLEDTHSVYRVGTNFKKIMDNASAFIESGGSAEWAFLRFKHNEHQVDEARELATQKGFKEFVMKDSSRWLLDTKFPVFNSNGNTEYFLEPSQYSTMKFIDINVINDYESLVSKTKINCHALYAKEIYINAQGHVFPCCWIAMIPYQPMDQAVEIHHIRNQMLEQYYELVESLGGADAVNTAYHTVKNIIDSSEYQTIWDFYWNESKLITCARSCGVMPDYFSTPNDQFITREKL
jgi:MoaA/NifB/PqqE/SkfB family radical SAM enzyme